MKFRDLQQSHDFRETVKQWGEPTGRRRVIVAQSSTEHAGKSTEITSSDVTKESPKKGDVVADVDAEIKAIQPAREELKTWVAERKALREGLNSLCLSKSLLQNKPNKTECEARVLAKMLEKENKDRFLNSKIPTIASIPSIISPGHVAMLPYLDSPLPIALAIIADYLQEHRMRLLDLFSKADRNKDWLTTREELRDSLKQSGVPLSESQIDELVLTLDLNNDDQLSYKELAMGIDAYRKDKRWRKLKEIFDVLVEKGDAEQELTESYNERNTAMDLLRLPQYDGMKQNNELIDSLNARAKKNRMLSEKAERRKRRVKTKDGIKPEYLTTLTGFIGDSKMRYLQFIDKECKRCIEQLHNDKLPSKSEDLVSVLLPPCDKTRNECENFLSCEQSWYPSNHYMNRKHREVQSEQSHYPSCPFTFTNTTPPSTSSPASLPRVATTDFKNKAKDGRKRLEQYRRTSPTPCWPQHLLDKLRLYMENESSDGKEALFTQIKNM